jgi:hypothetical protein
MKKGSSTAFFLCSIATAFLSKALPQTKDMGNWYDISLYCISGTFFILAILSFCGVTVFRSPITKENRITSKNYRNISRIHFREPMGRFPIYIDYFWILIALIILSVGILALYNTIVNGAATSTPIWRWVLFGFLFIAFQIWIIIQTIIEIITWDRKYKAKISKYTKDATFAFPNKITTVYDKCLGILDEMNAEIFEMDRNSFNPIKAWVKNSIFGDSVFVITLTQIGDKDTNIRIVSNSQWINNFGVIYNTNQKLLDKFRKSLK